MMKNTENIIKLIEAYEEILYGNDTHSGMIDSLDPYYALCFTEGLKQVENLRQDVVKNLIIPVVSNNEVAVCDHSKHTYFTIWGKTKKCNGCNQIYEAN